MPNTEPKESLDMLDMFQLTTICQYILGDKK